MDARDKWHIKNKGRIFLKIHVAVNVKTKKIISMKITDEHVHDSKALPGLVDEIIKSDKKNNNWVNYLQMVLMKVDYIF